jgi:hypothetical protein
MSKKLPSKAQLYIHAIETIARLKPVLLAARVALDTCRAGMKPLVRDGVHSQTFNASAEQCTAAWRDLRRAVEAAEDGDRVGPGGARGV